MPTTPTSGKSQSPDSSSSPKQQKPTIEMFTRNLKFPSIIKKYNIKMTKDRLEDWRKTMKIIVDCKNGIYPDDINEDRYPQYECIVNEEKAHTTVTSPLMKKPKSSHFHSLTNRNSNQMSPRQTISGFQTSIANNYQSALDESQNKLANVSQYQTTPRDYANPSQRMLNGLGSSNLLRTEFSHDNYLGMQLKQQSMKMEQAQTFKHDRKVPPIITRGISNF